ncbi:MAG: hypothetical protein F6K56_18275, partial [Moorea sp. SIO3G5]|nr:hypothetical protein [Moorena sp. SIO3G5]
MGSRGSLLQRARVGKRAILSEAPAVAPLRKEQTAQPPLHLLTLSAKTKPALEQMVHNYAEYFATHPNLDWA